MVHLTYNRLVDRFDSYEETLERGIAELMANCLENILNKIKASDRVRQKISIQKCSTATSASPTKTSTYRSVTVRPPDPTYALFA